jgi:hypothetical protein
MDRAIDLAYTRVDSSAAAMMHDLATGEIDAGILWGPMAGYYARQATPAATVVALIKETTGVGLSPTCLRNALSPGEPRFT